MSRRTPTMLGNLAGRAIVPVALAVTGFVTLCCFVLYSFMKADLTAAAVQQARTLADTVVRSTRHAMLTADRDDLGNIISNIGAQEGVLVLRIFDGSGRIVFSGDRRELNQLVDRQASGCTGCHDAGAPHAPMEQARFFRRLDGEEVIAVTAAIRNEPACATAACHVHAADRKVLGTLDIGLSTAPFRSSLARMRTRLTIFTLMVLVLSVGGVAALLRRNVFEPLRRLEEFAHGAASGRLGSAPPAASGDLAGLAATIAQLAKGLHPAPRDGVGTSTGRHGA